MAEEDWYSNKELFEMFDSMKQDMGTLRVEMQETRSIIKQYNGLREKFGDIENQLSDLRIHAHIRNALWSGVYKWGGWIVGVASVMVLIFKH